VTGDPEWERFLETEADVRFVTVGAADEHRLRVIEVGASSPVSEPVLLVHGFADSVYTWHRNLRTLAEAGFRVLAYDHPGYGESALPEGFCFGVDVLTQLALDLLDALGIERVHLIGHSMGGGIGLQLAVHHPDRLRRAVLVAPVCYHAPFRPFIGLARWSLVGDLAHRLSGPWLARLFFCLQPIGHVLPVQPVVAQYSYAFRHPKYICACVGVLRDYWNQAFEETSCCYRRIGVPLHLVCGTRDLLVNARFVRRLAADTRAGLTVVNGVGHQVHMARPELFNEVAVRFLRSEG
jgi:pimeloyl-ACP methyl ester carboxylesterase